jgi:hypothetical protein
MHVRKLFVVAAMGICFALGATAQTDAGAASSGESGAKPPSKSSKKRTTRKSSKSKSSTSKSSKSSSRKRKKKSSPPAATTQPAAAPAALPELPVPDDGEAPQLTHEAGGSGTRGKPLTIAAHAADANGVFGPILYVRKQGLSAGDYVPIRMVASKIVPGDYAVDVPAGLTGVDGLEYYIEAWDMAGNGPARVGSAEAPLLARIDEEKKAIAPPTTVTIRPKGAAPAISHSAVASAPRGKPVEINARLVGDSGVQGAAVMFRHAGEKDYKALPMGNIGGDDYTATIPAGMATSDLEYYVEAYDRLGNGPARSGAPNVPYALKLMDPAPAVAPAPARPLASKRMLDDEPDPTYIGIGIDGGAPGGGGATLLVRPLWWLRLNAGLAYNVAGFGYRGGITLAPGAWAVTPTLNLDVGQYLSGDLTKFVNVTDPNVNIANAERALLSKTTYRFATAQIGLEFGSQRRFSFYLRGGLTYFDSTLSGAQVTALVQSHNPNPGNPLTINGNPKFSAIVPCASLGFNIFVY